MIIGWCSIEVGVEVGESSETVVGVIERKRRRKNKRGVLVDEGYHFFTSFSY